MPNLPRVPMPWAWILATIVLTVVATLIFIRVFYPSLDDPMPVHWNAAGQPNRFEPKSIGNFLSTILLGPVILLISSLSAAGLISMQSGAVTQRGGAKTAHEARRTHGALQRLQVLLAQFMFALNLIIVLMLGDTYRSTENSGLALVVGVIAIVAACVGLIWAQVRVQASLRKQYPLPPGESEKWWGIFYNDPDDPRILVDTGSGSNFTFNIGRRAGKIAALALFGVPAIVVVVLIVSAF